MTLSGEKVANPLKESCSIRASFSDGVLQHQSVVQRADATSLMAESAPARASALHAAVSTLEVPGLGGSEGGGESERSFVDNQKVTEAR